MENAPKWERSEGTYQAPSVAHCLRQHLRPADCPRRHDSTALSSERSDLALELGDECSSVGVRAVDHLLGIEGSAGRVYGVRTYVQDDTISTERPGKSGREVARARGEKKRTISLRFNALHDGVGL